MKKLINLFSFSYPSTSPSTQEPVSKAEPNSDLGKGINKLTKISMLFLIIMLIPILSDPSINISIIPFFLINKESLQLHSKNIVSSLKKYFIFIYYILILIVIITLDSTITLDEPQTIDILIFSGLVAKLKSKLTRTDSSSSISTIKGETSSTIKSSEEVISPETSQNHDDVVDIRRGSEWYIPHQTYQLEETMSMTSIDSESSSEHSITCSTCPGISTATVDSTSNPMRLESDSVSIAPTYIEYIGSQVSIPNLGQNIDVNISSSNFSVTDNSTDTSSVVSSFDSQNSMEISESDFPLNQQIARLREEFMSATEQGRELTDYNDTTSTYSTDLSSLGEVVNVTRNTFGIIVDPAEDLLSPVSNNLNLPTSSTSDLISTSDFERHRAQALTDLTKVHIQPVAFESEVTYFLTANSLPLVLNEQESEEEVKSSTSGSTCGSSISSQSFINSPNEEQSSLSNSLTTTNLLITLLMVFTNIILLKYIISSKTYKNIISNKRIKQLMESKVFKYIKNSIVMKVIITTMLSFSLKIILVNIFLFIILPILVALLPLVIFLDNIILSNVSETNLKLIIESTTNYYTDSSGSSSNSSNLCTKILKLFNNLFKIKTKTVYDPIPDAEEDDFNTHVNNNINPYSTISPVQEATTSSQILKKIYSLEVSQESNRKIITNIQLANEREVFLEDDRTKDQSKWWDSDSENLLLKEEEVLDEPSSRLFNDNLKNLKLNKIRKRVQNWSVKIINEDEEFNYNLLPFNYDNSMNNKKNINHLLEIIILQDNQYNQIQIDYLKLINEKHSLIEYQDKYIDLISKIHYLRDALIKNVENIEFIETNL